MRWVRAHGRVELGADGRPERLLGTAQDITEQKGAADALLHQELHDPLTGLPNRRLLVDRIDQALARLTRVPSIIGVIHLDLDRFKVINDNLGHAAGDELLLATSVRLRDLIRPEDTLARIDGDEFVVLCEGLSDQAEAVMIADRICAAMTEPFAWSGGELVLSVSAGVALAISASIDAGALLGDADAAMYRAKAAGRARTAVFAETMRPTGVGRLDTETSLRQSIVNGDLRVHYQPIVSLVDGQVLGHEALVRWAHPARGLLGPDEFITVAEESGLIVPLGAWVLREACMQAKRFQTRDPRWPRLMMSVNLSGAQLGQPDLVDLVASALHDAELERRRPPARDDRERPDGRRADDDQRSSQSLKDLGVHLSIDDFGTGYSSLAYLRRFPVDVLKIDRTFVGGLGKDLEDSAIVAAVVNLADTLGFATIAEGVETELQRDCLIGLGCTRAQGYLFARPVAAAEAETALDRVAGAVATPAESRALEASMTATVSRNGSIDEPVDESVDANALLTFLEQVKRGDFSARMPLDWTGVAGKVADGFNEFVSRQRDLLRRAGARQRGRRQAGQAVAADRRCGGLGPRWSGPIDVGQQPDRRPRAPHQRDAARDRRGRRRRPQQEGLGRRPRRDARAQEHDQRDGRSAQRVHLRGDARRPRGRHRGQARPGGRGDDRGRRRVEGPHRQRQPDGRATSPARCETSPR